MKSKYSLLIGKPFGISVLVHWTFSLLIVWIVFISLSRGLDINQIIMYILFVFALFVCVVLHELGHSLTAIRLGGKVQSIILLPIGGVANISEMPEKPREEFLISAAGPLVNVVIAAILWVYLAFINPIALTGLRFDIITTGNFLALLLAANIFIVVFNLIPAFPMDGGRLFRSALSLKMSRIKATKIAKDIGQVFAVLFIIAGFFYNPFLIVIGFFIILGAKAEYEMIRYKDILNNYNVKELLQRSYIEMDALEPLAKAADSLIHSNERGIVVTSGGEFCGILTKNDLIRGLNTSGKEGKIEDNMSKHIEAVHPGMSLFDVFRTMQKNGNDMAPVMSDKNKFIGVIDREAINEFFMIRKAMRDEYRVR